MIFHTSANTMYFFTGFGAMVTQPKILHMVNIDKINSLYIMNGIWPMVAEREWCKLALFWGIMKGVIYIFWVIIGWFKFLKNIFYFWLPTFLSILSYTMSTVEIDFFISSLMILLQTKFYSFHCFLTFINILIDC